MKKIFTTLVIIFSLALNAQEKVKKIFIASQDVETGNIPGRPYLRVTARPMTITTDWQKIRFNGVADFNANTFTEVDGLKEVRVTDGLFSFNTPGLRIYTIDSYWAFKGDISSTTRIYIKHVIPGTGIEYPFPDTARQFQLAKLGRNESIDVNYTPDFRTTSTLRDKGFEIWIKASRNTPILKDLIFIIYAL